MKFSDIKEGAKYFKNSLRGTLIAKGTFTEPGGLPMQPRNRNLPAVNCDTIWHCAVFRMPMMSDLDIGVDNEEYRKLLKSVTKVLIIYHKKNILHGDIKPDNILGSRGNYKLADWNRAVDLKNGIGFSQISNRGTVPFQAPECDNDFTDWTSVPLKDIFKTDVYALGASVAYMLLQALGESFSNVRQMISDLQSMKFHKKYGKISLEMLKLLNLLKNMTAKDVSKRFSLEKVLQDSYLKMK